VILESEDEDVTFRPDEAEIRADEVVCEDCNYLHYYLITCPNCHPLTKVQYEKLAS
jgi:hypothetical protein